MSFPHIATEKNNANYAHGKLRQTCVLAGSLGDCWDWNIRTGGSSNTLLNLYNSY